MKHASNLFENKYNYLSNYGHGDKCTKMIQKSPLSEKFLRKTSISATRNAAHIQQILKKVLPKYGSVLEIGSGTGQHSIVFAEALPSLKWIPSDADNLNFDSINGWRQLAINNTPDTPRLIDASSGNWFFNVNDNITSIVVINVIHISPWSVTKGILKGAQKILPRGGVLYFYGPFIQDNIATAHSNLAFDNYLKTENSSWGLRNLKEIESLAQEHSLVLEPVIKMPANNLSVIFKKK